MPELPEVEVTRLGIQSHIQGHRIARLVVRNASLRWPVPARLAGELGDTMVESVERRGKFILIGVQRGQVTDRNLATSKSALANPHGTLIVHLGMTGTLRVVPADTALKTHDHVDLVFAHCVLRYNDPRRFGAMLWHDATEGDIGGNKHLAQLGVEPLTQDFEANGGALLFAQTRGRNVSIKQLLLAGQIVVGVGNIYASESLFRAGIHPAAPAGRIGLARYTKLAEAIRATLTAAIAKGGSTLRDFVGSDGASGYFQLDYFVYDRVNMPCRICATPIRAIRQGQRSTFYCPRCQKY